ncbi:MAG: hypothetical protein SFU91_11700 [Chloroherpetonaceae bacterium]|nr:hypothetical protein [Chloroherpetonaceae bacterium]
MTIENYFFYGVIIVMPFFALISLFNRLRIKHSLLSIRHGILFGFPLLPSIYALVQFFSIALAYLIGDDESVIKFTGYFFASIFWFLGSAASEQRLVLNEGILLSINSPSRSLLRWAEVTDYFTRSKNSYTEYHFFRNIKKEKRGKKIVQRKIEIIRVQNGQKEEFEKLIRTFLEPRFDIDSTLIQKNEFKSKNE